MRTRINTAGVLVTLLVLSLGVVAFAAARQQAMAPTPPGLPGGPPTTSEPKTGTGLILGRVVSAGSNTGVSDAIVTLTSPALGASGVIFGGNNSRRISTDGEGHFLFRDLPEGVYQFQVSAPGYVTGGYGQARPGMAGRSFTLADGEKVGDLTIQLWKQGTISGVVVDEAGEPMVDVSVRIMARPSPSGAVSMSSAVSTDDRGMYHVDVTPGDYTVGVTSAPTTMPASTIGDYAKAQAAGPAASRAYIDSMMAAGAPIPGNSGFRIGDFVLAASGGRGGTMVQPPASPDDRLFLYPTTYYPASRTAASAIVVTIGSGERKTGIDLQLKPVPTYRVSGTVIGPSGPSTNMGVRLVTSDPAGPSSLTGVSALIVQGDSLQSMTDGKGEFTLLGVVPGQYVLRVLRTPVPSAQRQSTSISVSSGGGSMMMSSGGGDMNAPVSPEPILWATLPVTVTDADVTGLAVALRTGARVSGHVEFSGSEQPPTPDKLQSLRVTLQAVPGSPSALVSAPSSSHIDDNGQFTTSQFAPGSYLISGGGIGWVLKSAMVGGKDAADVAIEVGATDLTDVIVTMSDKRSMVSGVVAAEQGEMVSSSIVVVFATDQAFWPKSGMRSRRVSTAAPGRDGKFTFNALPAGDYFLVAVSGNTALDFTDAKVLSSLAGQATRISVSEGGTVTQDLRTVAIK